MISRDLKIIMEEFLSSKNNSMQRFTKQIKNNEKFRFIKNLFTLIFKLDSQYLLKSNKHKIKINFIVEKANWAIKWDGIYITNSINNYLKKDISKISSIPIIKSNKKIVHFASQYMWLDWQKLMPNKHKYVVSFFHGKPDDSPEVKKHINDFLKSQKKIHRIITASTLVESRLIQWGIEKSKIALIHTGVNTKIFNIPSKDKRIRIREKLGFLENDIVIGSFQKDGIGWGKGYEPKIIKGPDIFVNAIEIIAKELPVTVLLTGPSRGYVKKELIKRNIKFKHIYIDNYEDIKDYYHALDLYIVSSREEGGPKPMIESMASGVPVVTTNVGMSKDFIKDKVNGGIIDSFDPIDLANKSLEILNKPKEELISMARKDVLKSDWDIVAKLHWEKVYKPLLESLE